MNLRIIKAGIMDSVQDVGRYGHQVNGINPGGAMDKYAVKLANALAGNDLDDAVIELHFPASAFFFEVPALIVITGADLSPTINGDPIPNDQPVVVSKFSILQFQRMEKGLRAYLAINGGFNLKKWLGSYSTNLKAVAGGHHGRILQKDDEIGIKTNSLYNDLLEGKEFHVFPWRADLPKEFDSHEIKVIRGHEWDLLTDTSKENFTDQLFTMTTKSDRMASCLKGENLVTKPHEELVSSAVDYGTIQLLPDGQLIILMADHQTTGGYPRIAHIITAQHSCVAQLRAGDRIGFMMVDVEEAEDQLFEKEKYLQQLQYGCRLRLEEFIK